MLKLDKFARSFSNATTDRPFQVIGTGATIKATVTGDPMRPNENSFRTSANLSGELIRDPSNGSVYLVDRLSRDYNGFWRGIIRKCNKTANLYRFPASAVDGFNRPLQSERVLVQADIPIHFIGKSTGSREDSPIMPIYEIRRHALIQSLHGVGITDIITTPDGDSYRVVEADNGNYGLTRLFLEQIL